MIYDARQFELVEPYKDYLFTNPGDIHRLSKLMDNYFNIKTVSSLKDAKIISIDICWYIDYCKNVDIEKMLGKKVIAKLIDGDAILVFFFAHESFHPGNIDPQWDEFKLYLAPKLRNLNIPFSNIYFITGDLKTHTLHKDGVEEINLIGIDVFSEVVGVETNADLPDDYFTNDIEFNLNKPKDFLYLNGVPRPAKCILKYHLEQEGLLDNGIHSWMHRNMGPKSEDIKDLVSKYSVKYRNNYKDIIDSANRINLLDADYSNINILQDKFPREFLKDTCFNLVPETNVLENTFFITEKTYKTILFKHPFLLWSNPFMLKYLRSLGYVTFSSLFDETYDVITPESVSKLGYTMQQSLDYKLDIISSNIKNFRERAIGQEKITNEILKHNRELLITKNPARENNKKSLLPIIERAEQL